MIEPVISTCITPTDHHLRLQHVASGETLDITLISVLDGTYTIPIQYSEGITETETFYGITADVTTMTYRLTRNLASEIKVVAIVFHVNSTVTYGDRNYDVWPGCVKLDVDIIYHQQPMTPSTSSRRPTTLSGRIDTPTTKNVRRGLSNISLLGELTSSGRLIDKPYGIFTLIQPKQVLLRDDQYSEPVTHTIVSGTTTDSAISWVFPRAPYIHYEFFFTIPNTRVDNLVPTINGQDISLQPPRRHPHGYIGYETQLNRWRCTSRWLYLFLVVGGLLLGFIAFRTRK